MNIICDVDGTITIMGDRRHLILQYPHRQVPGEVWEQFHARAMEDKPRPEVRYMLQEWARNDHVIWLMTGRSEPYRALTRSWLQMHHVPYHHLFMRPEGDYRSDHVLKEAWYREHLAHQSVLAVLEDRSSVVAMWRSLGLCCLQLEDVISVQATRSGAE